MVTDNGLVSEDVVHDLFPVGMHVLAVDDNQICLNVLENMLLKCHYKVTTTTQSVKALEMLRKNRDMFDLVICDVNMPEMDGFRLLKQVGQLEMDLPFIMLSGHGDTESVMKGVMNGASDYILKPIRMEEVKTIWQHVVRKKIDGKDQRKVSGATNNEVKKVCGDNNVEKKLSGATNNEVKNVYGDNNMEKKVSGATNNEEKKVSGDNNEEKKVSGENNVARVCSPDTTSDQNVAGKDKILGQKRKERSDSEEDNDTDGSTEKKPRFVWDAVLHNKFVVAVNQLGFDKAYPKKILELMNVEGLTRENVASHLQKFRLSLKRSDKQSRTDAIFDSTSPYLPMGSIGGRRFKNSALPSYASPSYGSSQLVCRLNTPSALNFTRTSYGSVPSFQSRNNINCFEMPLVSANERPCFSIVTNQFQQNNYQTGYMKLPSIEGPKAYTASSSYQGLKVAANDANSSFVSCIPSFPHPLTYNVNSSSFSCIPSNQPLTHNLEALTKDSSVGVADVKRGSQSMINPLDSVKPQSLNSAASLAKSDGQLITKMPEIEKFYTDSEAMNSNDDCFYNQMLSLQPGFFDNSYVSLDDIYLS